MKIIDKYFLNEKITSNIEKDIKDSVISGASVIVAQSGEVLVDKQLGYSDIERKIPLKRDSIFRIASMTKPITAAAALIAEERGYFSLNDPVTRYFPEFSDIYVGRLEDGEVVKDHKPRIIPTLSDLLSHTSGFMCSSSLYAPQYGKIPAYAYENNRTLTDWCLKNTCLTFDPCEAVGYGAHLPFDLIAVLIEDRSGMSFSDFLDENIFKPLGIKDITYHPTEEQWSRVVTMCDRGKNTPLFNKEMGRHTFADHPLSYTSAGAGLVGSISDYFIFAEMLRRNGKYGEKRILSEKSVRKMSTSVVKNAIIGSNSTTSFGLSVRVILSGYPFLNEGCYGWSGAYGTHFFIDPENEITAIYMKNTYTYDSLGAGRTGREFEKAVTFAKLTVDS